MIFLGRLDAYRNGSVTLLDALFAVGLAGAARVQSGDVVDRELVEVRDIVDQAGGDHLVDDLVTQAVNVHAAAAPNGAGAPLSCAGQSMETQR